MIDYYGLGVMVFIVLLIIFFTIITPIYFEKNTIKTQSCKVDRYVIKHYYNIVIVKDRLIDRDICRFDMKDKKLAYELAELCIQRIGGCEDE